MEFKKSFFLLIIIFIISVTNSYAQAFLNTAKYFDLFPLSAGETISNNDFIWAAGFNDYKKFAALTGNEGLIDSGLEFALLSFYSQSVIGKRPAGANTILPSSNQVTAGLKIGAAILKELSELQYFTPENTAAIQRYQEMLSFVGSTHNITRTQFNQYYRLNIRSLIAEIVNEEFNKICFSISNMAERRWYYMMITRFPSTGRYTLDYETPAIKPVVHTISADTRESLFSEMSGRTSDFSQSEIDLVRGRAAMIPAVALTDAVCTDAINTISAFYMTMNNTTFSALGAKWRELFAKSESGPFAASSFARSLSALSEALADIGQ